MRHSPIPCTLHLQHLVRRLTSQYRARRIYAIKGRDGAKPIAICVAETSDLAKYATVTVSQELLDELLPGPVTLCFKRSSALNPELNPTSDTIGIRIPDNRFIRALTAACDTALALTSANLSGQPSSVEVCLAAFKTRSAMPDLSCPFRSTTSKKFGQIWV